MAFSNSIPRFLPFALLFCLGLSAFQSSASYPPSHKSSMVKRHEEWMTKYGRIYKNNTEKELRFEIFWKNVELIEAHNKLNKGYTLSANEFADLTDEEFKQMYTGHRRPDSQGSSLESTSFRYENFTSVPASVNWVTAGAVTPIKNQGTCGSCWTFASVATVESLTWIKTGRLYSLSEQEILDCVRTNYDRGCSGGTATGAYAWIIRNGGITTESNYPYEGYQHYYCNGNAAAAARITGYQNVPSNNEAAMQQAVVNQPIAVVVEGSGYYFKFYNGGVLSGGCGTATDHVVAVVGYGTASDGTPYWLIKNSWGTNWGENGYIRLQRNTYDPRGRCGVAMYPAYPTYN